MTQQFLAATRNQSPFGIVTYFQIRFTTAVYQKGIVRKSSRKMSLNSLFRNSNPPSKTPLPIFRQSAPLKTFLDPLSPSLSGNVSCGYHSPMKNKILKFNFCFYNIIKKHKIKSTKLNLFLITKFINAG